MKALILAAGMGTRLLPYTKIKPKPLFPLNGTPVLKQTIEKLIDAGCTDIIINTHHLHRQIENFIEKMDFSANIETRYEPELLDTGGAIKNVRDFMGDSTFFVINSDIVSNIDLNKVWSFHINGNWIVTLVMHDYHEFNKVKLNEINFITGFKSTKQHNLEETSAGHQACIKIYDSKPKSNLPQSDSQEKLLAFTGIQVVSSEIFQYMPPYNKFSSIDIYDMLAQKGNYVKAYICTDAYWNDIGTINTYEKECLLHISIKCFNKIYNKQVNNGKYKTPGALPLSGKISDNASLYDTNFNLYSIIDKLKIEKLKGDGSDRKWFRIKISDKFYKELFKPSESLIIAHHGIYPEYTENSNTDNSCYREIDSFIAIGKMLLSVGVSVPEIYEYDLFSGMVALEDLGDVHFQEIINSLDSKDKIIQWYKKICDNLINFSINGIKKFDSSYTYQTKEYSRQLIIENECKYFINSFIQGYLKKTIKFDDLKEIFEFIADNALQYSFAGLMHRDMQSRNIMIKNNNIFFIDFQGARKGPLQYDLASLLIDPYVDLDTEIREKVLKYCTKKINGLTGFNEDKFIKCFRFCSITRNLQILGAFGYLSMVKGKKFFENYIPIALKTLKTNIKILNHDTNGKLESLEKIIDIM